VRVASLRRYPVKSLVGEQVERLEVDSRGCIGDRRWSIRTTTGRIGSGKSTRRFEAVAGLLELRATTHQGRVRIGFPDGRRCFADDDDADDLLTRHLGRAVTLAMETGVSHFDDGPVSLLGTASVAAVAADRREPVDPARFRPNILIDTDVPLVEDTWVGRRVQIGTATFAVTMSSPRCVMVDMPTADLPAQHGNLLATGRLNDACLGVIATVVTPGTIAVGDMVTIA
jgi:uncharacterized protein YcbX